jgi:hypothetical protein
LGQTYLENHPFQRNRCGVDRWAGKMLGFTVIFEVLKMVKAASFRRRVFPTKPMEQQFWIIWMFIHHLRYGGS